MLVLIEMYLQGVSARRVSRVVEGLCGFEISASQVSRPTRRLDEELGSWRARDLSEAAYPYLVVDAHNEKVRREGKVRTTAVLWVVGIREDGYGEGLGVWLGPTEGAGSWAGGAGGLLRLLTLLGTPFKKRVCPGMKADSSRIHGEDLSAFPASPRERLSLRPLREAVPAP